MVDNSGYPEELKEIGAAALFLVSLKYTKIEEDILAIEKLKRKIILGGKNGQNSISRKRTKASILAQEFNGENSKKLLRHPSTGIEEKVIMRLINNYNPSIIPLVPAVNGLIGKCSKPFEKQLTMSDAREDQSRLSINKADVEECLLPLLKEDEDLSKGIEVTTYDLKGNEFRMQFKIWVSKIYVLTGGWQAFFKSHNLKEHQDFVTLWMFGNLKSERLCFVISWRRLPVFSPLKKRRRVKKN